MRKGARWLTSADYRLLCSGILHRRCYGDWSKSEGARVLLDEPFRLFVVSRPFHDYPLELALHLTVPQVKEETRLSRGTHIYSYHPDEEIVRDLAALLSVQCRRLISVAGKVNEQHANDSHLLFGRQPYPMPITTSWRSVYWHPHPTVTTTSLTGQRHEDYNPRTKAVDSYHLTSLLHRLPTLPAAKSLVISSRLYALALELIRERPEISYQLLISSIETIANATLRSYRPTDEDMLNHKRPVYDLAIRRGLGEDVARELAIEACKGEWWATRKFKTFLTKYVEDCVWTETDELYHALPQEASPKREEFEQVLGWIYKARSKATHEGQSFPSSASYTGGPSIAPRSAAALFGNDSPFPPVVWFERIVNSALSGYWKCALSNAEKAG